VAVDVPSMEGREATRRAFLGAAGLSALGGLAGCVTPFGTQPADGPAGSTTATPTAASPYTRAYRETVDSVVLVSVTGSNFVSQGSGFVFDRSGHVLTNQHVVAGARTIEIRFTDGTWRPARRLGTDAYSDLAVLRVDGRPETATALPFVDAPPAIGTRVVAIGSPFGLEQSLTAGIVSGVHREIPTNHGFAIPDAVQTDAAVNPGNSGGPLVTLAGDVVGVIRSGGGENLGFAVSAALIERIAPRLASAGRYQHPYLGIASVTVTPTVASVNGLTSAAGILVSSVVPDGPSDGVLHGSPEKKTVNGFAVPVGGDVIVGVDDVAVSDNGALGRYLALETKPGQTIDVHVVRDGERRTVEVTLGTRPSPVLTPSG